MILLPYRSPRRFDELTPYVVSRPSWLVGEASGGDGVEAPTPPPWAARKLLFFSGHVPKVTIAPLRFELWKQLRRSEHVTALSSTIGCSVGAYSVCADGSRVELEYSTFCRGGCRARGNCAASSKSLANQCVRMQRVFNFSDAAEVADLEVRLRIEM